MSASSDKLAGRDRGLKLEILVWIEALSEGEIALMTEANTAVCEGRCRGDGEPGIRKSHNCRQDEHG
jgi:hypothetical protein